MGCQALHVGSWLPCLSLCGGNALLIDSFVHWTLVCWTQGAPYWVHRLQVYTGGSKQHMGGLSERLHRIRGPEGEAEEQPVGGTRTEVKVSLAEGAASTKAWGM